MTDFLEDVWGDGELRGTGIDDGGVAGVGTWLLHGFGSVGHSLAFESPCSKPVGEVLEGF